jgi:SH3-like domain-containing protein
MSKPNLSRLCGWRLPSLLAGCCLAAAVALAATPSAEAQTALEAPAAKLNVPRYASLKADNVQLRQGPGTEHPAAWLFKRTGLPVEIIEEAEVWRKVRDASGTEGWVHMTLLSGRRTALVMPWELKEGQAQAVSATLRDNDRENARAIAQVEAGVLAGIITCENSWCRISVGNYRGYIEQAKLWGTYPNETIKP